MTNYVKNYLGCELTDDQLQDIPYPRMELGGHVTARTFQVGCISATVYGTLKALSSQPTRNLAGISSTIGRVMPKCAVVGVLAGPLMYSAVIYGRKADEDGIIDRCYRLRRNTNQVRVDRFSDAGFITGLSGAVLAGGSPWMGISVGTTLGIVAASVYNSKIAEKK